MCCYNLFSSSLEHITPSELIAQYVSSIYFNKVSFPCSVCFNTIWFTCFVWFYTKSFAFAVSLSVIFNLNSIVPLMSVIKLSNFPLVSYLEHFDSISRCSHWIFKSKDYLGDSEEENVLKLIYIVFENRGRLVQKRLWVQKRRIYRSDHTIRLSLGVMKIEQCDRARQIPTNQYHDWLIKITNKIHLSLTESKI